MRFDIQLQTRKPKIFNHADPLVQRIISNPDFPFLVSFPRTGSHWLRMIMELYFNKPSLVHIFFYTRSQEFTCYHTHDMNYDKVTDVRRKNIIYLFRNPVDTIFSTLRYFEESLDNKERIFFWLSKYVEHVNKWMFEEDFSVFKTIIDYDKLKENPESEFDKVVNHFDMKMDYQKLSKALRFANKNTLKNKVSHDNVLRKGGSYEDQRILFKDKYTTEINTFFNKSLKNKSFD